MEMEHKVKAVVNKANTGAINVSSMDRYNSFAIQLAWTDDTQAPIAIDADTEVNITTDSFNIVGHGLATGNIGQMSSTATLPAGLAVTTDYWVIVVDADNFQLAASLSDAEAGTQIDITDIGTAASTHTYTATALASTTIKVQETVDNVNWYDISGVVTAGFTADGQELLQGTTRCSGIRTVLTITAGQVAVTETIFVREE